MNPPASRRSAGVVLGKKSRAAQPGTGCIAAGAIVWRLGPTGIEFAIVYRPRYQDWSWPKGKADRGETLPVTAIREVAEEIGQEIILGARLGETKLGSGRNAKRITYWEGRLPVGVEVAARQTLTAADVVKQGYGGGMAGQYVPDLAPILARSARKWATLKEIGEVVWVGAKTAAKLLTYSDDRKFLRQVLRRQQLGELTTHSLLILRHAKARKRDDWGGGEDTRPLLLAGSAQSENLVQLLAAYGASQLWTSPWARCELTVGPYLQAAAPAVRVERVEELTEAASRIDPQASAAAITAMFLQTAAGRSSTVICTHRPVLPLLLKTLQATSAVPRALDFPIADPWLRPGEMAVVHFAAGRAVNVERWEALPVPPA